METGICPASNGVYEHGNSGQGHSELGARHTAPHRQEDLQPLHRRRYAGRGRQDGPRAEPRGLRRDHRPPRREHPDPRARRGQAQGPAAGRRATGPAAAAGGHQDDRRVAGGLDERGLAGGISIKLTGLGLTLNEELCRANVEEIVEYAGQRGRFVRVDMEDSPHTDATLAIVHDTYRSHQNTGAVLQSYMRRSLEDAQNVIEAGFSVRLCKGIYDEPRAVAYKDFDTVRQNYIFLLDELLKGGVYVGIATHDEYLIWHALRLIHQLEIPEDRYEFQMLLGVDEELRSILVKAGHKVRVYVPYGEDWYEYSTRRLKENQIGRAA